MRAALIFLCLSSLARADSSVDRWAPTGLDVKALDATQRAQALKLLDKFASPCGRAHSLYTSVTTDKACKRASFAARFVVFLAALSLPDDELQQHYEERFVTPNHGECKPDAQVRGEEKARLVICEFSDYQCPHCRAAEPALRKILDEYKGRVKLLFKNFPLSSHADARPAAAAALAAAKQGRFWPMHDLLFEHQDKMGTADLEKYARELKLDLGKWQADLAAAGERVDADRAEGMALHVDHTPTIYIGGREYRGPLRYEFLKDWVDEALATQ
jgi:predicted DsbA family dithiol-disulfide isomerase